jgi:sucrose-6-phosphate hydrolase SacC (GH32 family)
MQNGLWVLKYSVQAQNGSPRGDYYEVGTYDADSFTFVRDERFETRLFDAGNFYASKSFLDSATGERVLWGYLAEEDDEAEERGWQGPCNNDLVCTLRT